MSEENLDLELETEEEQVEVELSPVEQLVNNITDGELNKAETSFSSLIGHYQSHEGTHRHAIIRITWRSGIPWQHQYCYPSSYHRAQLSTSVTSKI